MQTLNRVLRPNREKIILLSLFMAIALGGMIQAWAFSDVPPKPPLYDFVRPLPIWSIWMFLLIPLAILSSPLKLFGLNVMGGASWVFMTANLIYFYVLACFLSAIYGWIKDRRVSRRQGEN
ncbi:MAG: hypothetical protein IZT55_00640 [Anaerolineae bacterium]|nr:hypothetical protein [Anaerolineae bacterium]